MNRASDHTVAVICVKICVDAYLLLIKWLLLIIIFYINAELHLPT